MLTLQAVRTFICKVILANAVFLEKPVSNRLQTAGLKNPKLFLESRLRCTYTLTNLNWFK